jgi:hypothetical protein
MRHRAIRMVNTILAEVESYHADLADMKRAEEMAGDTELEDLVD